MGNENADFTQGFAFGGAENVQQMGDESPDLTRSPDFAPDLNLHLGPPTGLVFAFRVAIMSNKWVTKVRILLWVLILGLPTMSNI